MKSIDQKLIENQYRIIRGKYLRKQLHQLNEQLEREQQTLQRLKGAVVKENEDVSRLANISMKRLFSVLNGRGELRLEKEKAEAFRAALDYKLKQNDIEYLSHQKNLLISELKAYDHLDQNYQELLEIKRKMLSPDVLNMIREQEKKLADAKYQQKELKEALESGNKLCSCFTYILDHLNDLVEDSTEARSLWYPTISQDQIDDVMKEIGELNVLWNHFMKELRDTDIELPQPFEQEFLLNVSDYMADGNGKENKRINTSYDRLNATYSDVRELLCLISVRLQESEYQLFDQQLKIEESIACGE